MHVEINSASPVWNSLPSYVHNSDQYVKSQSYTGLTHPYHWQLLYNTSIQCVHATC